MKRSKQAFVIGGGPAGLVAAIALRRKGLRVTVADGGDSPSDKACGEGILPEGIATLERLGIALDWTSGRAFRGIRFVRNDAVAQAQFGAAAGLGMRRVELHLQLIRAAELSGVSILWRTPVGAIADKLVTAGKHKFSTDWIIGADGFHSQARHWAGLESGKSPRLHFAFRQHFACSPWTDCVEVHWAEKAQLYVTPVSANEVGVVVLSRRPGAVKAIYDIALPYPRDAFALRGSAEFGRLETTIWQALRDEFRAALPDAGVA